MKKILVKILVFYLRHIQFFIDIKLTINKLKKYQYLLSGQLLDIGAGRKPYAKYFKNIKQYVATNTKRHYNQQEFELTNKYTDVWINDGTDLPFDDKSFDSAVCFQVLSVIQNPNLFFKQVNRILKYDGTFILTTNFLYPKWGKENYMRHTDKNLELLCKKNNFEIVKIESYGGFWTMIYSMLIRYIRSYPEKIKHKKNILLLIISVILFIISLLLLPLIGLTGWLIYFSEKNITDEFNYSMNNMLIARKKSDMV